MDTPKPPSGEDIWTALKAEMADNLYALPFSTLAPSVYHVYLHQEDFDEIEGIVPRIVSELARALTGEVQRINQQIATRGSRLWNLLRQTAATTPVELPAGGWQIYIQPDHDGALPRNSLMIVSRLMMPAPPEYSGTPTMRVVKTVIAADGQRTSTSTTQAAAATGPATSGSMTGRRDSGDGDSPSTAAGARSNSPRATLVYRDDEGPHKFPVMKERIKVGRGAEDTWVDVQLMTSDRVSREHCWIVSDATGRFFIQDVSTGGTSVNGERLPPPKRSADGKVVEPGASRELPPDARILLSDALTIQFQVADA